MMSVKTVGFALCLALCASCVVASDTTPTTVANADNPFNAFENFFGDGSFSSMFESMNKMMQGPLKELHKSSVEIKVDAGDDETRRNCHFIVHFGDIVTASDLSVHLDPVHRQLYVSYTRQEKMHDTSDSSEKAKVLRTGFSKSSSRASVLIPDFCIASLQTLKNGYGGWTDNLDEADASHHKMMIVFPSFDSIAYLVESGDVPADSVALVSSTRPRNASDLTHLQHCLISGFTQEECEVLGDIKPASSESPHLNSHGLVHLPRYRVSLHTFRPNH